MDKAIKHHFGKDINEKVRLTGGYTFETWLLTLSDNQKVVFRTQRDFETGGGRKIIIADILEREKFFYDNANKVIGHICPNVYIIDDSREFHDTSYCIMEYIEGTPLNICFDDFSTQTKNNILSKIGEIAASINCIKIDTKHPYVTGRETWENYVANSLQERLLPLVTNDVISHDEVGIITKNMRSKKAEKTDSFLHLDMRRINMIYNKGDIFILDAENCEFGDPLFELAVIDVGGELEPPLIKGYKSFNKNIDLNNELYNYYKMERLALVLHLFMNIIKSDTQSTKLYLDNFYELKKKLLKL
jgi:fructosamine-3-kinase